MSTEIVDKDHVPGTRDSQSPSGLATDQEGVAAAKAAADKWAAKDPAGRLVSVHSEKGGTAVEKHIITGK